jgi:hypothetical protein
VRVRFPRIAFLFGCAVSLALPLMAQSPNGTINGRVLDPSNKVIGAADILLINDATGVQYSGKTNDDGIYVVPNLPPGAYRLQVSKRGFKTLIKPDIVLNIQDALSINFTLPIGAAFEIVTVEGGASMINTTDASVSTVVDRTFVENMPLNGRSFQNLLLLTPGVVTQSPQGNGEGGEFSVNGQRTQENSYTVDGVSANVGITATAGGVERLGGISGSVSVATALGTTQALLSVDALQEFRVQSSSYSAEYGRSPGGQFVFETKSGTNQWHGTAYDYLRNGALDAQDWFTNYFGEKSAGVRQNDFGGTLGGPVSVPEIYRGRDRTFFFISYEGLRLTAPQAAAAYFVPDEALRASAPAPLQEALNAFPAPSANGIDDSANGIAQFIGSWSNPSSINSVSLRLDHVVGANLRLFFRFGDTTSGSTMRGVPFNAPSVQTISAYTARTYTAGAIAAFSNRLSNDFRLNYSSNRNEQSNVIDPIGGSSQVDLLQLSGLAPRSTAILGFAYGGYFPELTQSDNVATQEQWNVVNTMNLLLGRHHLKFGVDYRRLAPFTVPSTPFLSYDYQSESAVMTNAAAVVGRSDAAAYPLYKNFSAFVQDEWAVLRRLNLSLGVRWDVNPPPGVTQGLMPYTVLGSGPSTWTLAPQGTPLWHTAWHNFAPRLGVAYILHDAPSWTTVLRAGGGIFFDTGQQTGSDGFNGVGFRAMSFFSAPFPANATGTVPPIVNPPVQPYSTTVYGFASHLQVPYTIGWNVSIEQALGKMQAVSVSYVASHAAKLQRLNVYLTDNFSNGVGFYSNGLTSDYDSLQVQFRRRLSQGLTALASYTWSHCIDYGSLNFNFIFMYQRGNCDFDVRQNLSAASSYDLPNVGHNRLVGSVLHHWGLDDHLTVRTGFPITLLGPEGISPLTGELQFSGLNLVPGQAIYLYGDNCASVLQGLGNLPPGHGCPGGRAVDPQAFTAPTSCCGNAPRNLVRGFGAWQLDLAVRREFRIRDNLKLQFRAEAFNTFNHPNFGTINPSFGQETFGQATGTLANSLGILSPLYQMGGPRSMQFAVKFIF